MARRPLGSFDYVLSLNWWFSCCHWIADPGSWNTDEMDEQQILFLSLVKYFTAVGYSVVRDDWNGLLCGRGCYGLYILPWYSARFSSDDFAGADFGHALLELLECCFLDAVTWKISWVLLMMVVAILAAYSFDNGATFQWELIPCVPELMNGSARFLMLVADYESVSCPPQSPRGAVLPRTAAAGPIAAPATGPSEENQPPFRNRHVCLPAHHPDLCIIPSSDPEICPHIALALVNPPPSTKAQQ
ncbi:hypothetical protein Nepgr_003839 [Nepenthes gracilis]|uniref:Uncharacterized protein n=1 Tax=Nepenthes gracilis TaxID=150966 RepID=A0AAD3S099_NEPGR|nr:hypothetical protein Nepgr_003839 [Nepenthes gracilis]